MSARRALELQAGLYPNPEVALEFENVGGTGDRTGFEETETTLWISQRVPLGGKIGERQRVAALEGDLAQRSLESTRREVVADTTNLKGAIWTWWGRKTRSNWM
jgi:cobalt-zinc-cadmium efflux system outer membrane protein